MDEASDGVEEARQIVLARLAAAEAERKAAAAERKEVANALSDPGESISKYLAEFSSALAGLHGGLEALRSTQPEEASRDPKKVQEQLDALTAEAFQVHMIAPPCERCHRSDLLALLIVLPVPWTCSCWRQQITTDLVSLSHMIGLPALRG